MIKPRLLLVYTVLLGLFLSLTACNEDNEAALEEVQSQKDEFIIENYLNAVYSDSLVSEMTDRYVDDEFYHYFHKDLDSRKVNLGDSLSVTYTGWVLYGEIFDSSLLKDEPFTMVLGKTSVIEGWEDVLFKMSEGDSVRAYFPSQKAYGETGNAPTIPPNANLVFDIKVDKIFDQ